MSDHRNRRSESRDSRQAGDSAQCPACGLSMAPAAYRCPRCWITICFNCRRELRVHQYQCVNQQCDLYAKPLCDACTFEVPQMGPRSRQELAEPEKQVLVSPERQVMVDPGKPGGYSDRGQGVNPVTVGCSGIVAGAIGAFVLGLLGATIGLQGEFFCWGWVVVAVAVGCWVYKLQYENWKVPPVPPTYRTVPAEYRTVPPVYRTVTETVEVGRTRCCIACRQATQ